MNELYQDENMVRRLTLQMMTQGRTVFQLWQLASSEDRHSLRVLAYLNLPPNARVLSLGCGVGGMEAYWFKARPDLQFTLVNASQAQLDLCLCHGAKVLADIDTYSIDEHYDLVIVAYVLGHINVDRLLPKLKTMKVLVLDAFDTDYAFNMRMQYKTVPITTLTRAGYEPINEMWHQVLEEARGSRPGFLIKSPSPD